MARDYPWLAEPDERFTLALVLDVCEVLTRHGYPALAGGRSSTSPSACITPCTPTAATGHRPASDPAAVVSYIRSKAIAKSSPKRYSHGVANTYLPVLLDEWQAVPSVLGAVKRAVDDALRPGRRLSGS